ncbi:LytR family transcriptional regulator [Cryobacterium lactosi]|uniref:LytR family transcriptional regulator n=1 Tax=Cryobacterium lactosi TaxID=1259202 RepID=A0A4R9BG39_9MICO|nr:LCP family protein [Cryobacterium lactosi]TFD83723.1 LytR family transcriptional regulator [Cryobacterium lactosi]
MSDQLRPRSKRSKQISTIARHGRLKRSNAFANIAKVLAACLAVVMVSGVSVAALATLNVATSVKDPIRLESETEGPMPQISSIDGGANLLLVGSDSRAGQGGGYGDPEEETAVLNDVTMLLHIAEDHSSATVVSFPRDTYVPIPECTGPDGETYSAMSSQKINTTLNYGGLSCTVSTVEELTGLPIQYAAVVQFNGVAAMSEAVGGVPVCIAEPIVDEHTDLDLAAGEHELKGLEALQFLRTRYGVGDGSDLGRISNQQVFLSSLVRTLKSAETLSDPIKLYSIAKAAVDNMELSTSLQSMDTMVSIAMALKDIPLDKVVFVQYPVYNVDGGVQPDENAAGDLMASILADESPSLAPGEADFRSVADPAAGATEAPVDPAAPADPADPAAAEPAPTESALPSNVYGQDASQLTCSAGRTLADQ